MSWCGVYSAENISPPQPSTLHVRIVYQIDVKLCDHILEQLWLPNGDDNDHL